MQLASSWQLITSSKCCAFLVQGSWWCLCSSHVLAMDLLSLIVTCSAGPTACAAPDADLLSAPDL
jgi:hypothetical protein